MARHRFAIERAKLALEVADPLENGAGYQRERYGSVFKNLGKLATFLRRHKLAPGHGFGVGAAAQAAPVYRFRTNPDAVVVALQWQFLIAAAGHQFGVYAELLRPVARNATADSENSHALCSQHGGGKLFEVFKRVEAQQRAAIALAREFIQSKVDSQLRVAERRNKNLNIV